MLEWTSARNHQKGAPPLRPSFDLGEALLSLPTTSPTHSTPPTVNILVAKRGARKLDLGSGMQHTRARVSTLRHVKKLCRSCPPMRTVSERSQSSNVATNESTDAKGRGLAGGGSWTGLYVLLDSTVWSHFNFYCSVLAVRSTVRVGSPVSCTVFVPCISRWDEDFSPDDTSFENSLDETPIQVLSVSAGRVSLLVRHSERLKPKQRYTQTPSPQLPPLPFRVHARRVLPRAVCAVCRGAPSVDICCSFSLYTLPFTLCNVVEMFLCLCGCVCTAFFV